MSGKFRGKSAPAAPLAIIRNFSLNFAKLWKNPKARAEVLWCSYQSTSAVARLSRLSCSRSRIRTVHRVLILARVNVNTTYATT